MTRSNPFLGLFEERFGAPAGAALAIVRALPQLRETIADEAERLAAEAVATTPDASDEAPAPAGDSDDMERVEALRPAVVRAMLGGVGEVFAEAAGGAERGTLLLHALEHEFVLPPPAHTAGPADAAWRDCGRHVARTVLYGEAVVDESPLVAETPALAAPVNEHPDYAPMGQRLVAVVVDGAILYSAWGLLGVIVGLLGATFETEEALFGYVIMLSVPAYFALFHARWHATPGKALLGLAVEPDHPEGMGWTGRVLLRELIGRVLNQVLWGAGYWVAIRHPHKQSWGDRMAGTVVLRRQAPRWLRRTGAIAGLGAVLVGLSYAVLAAWTQDLEREDRLLSPQVGTAMAEMAASRARIDTLMTRYADGPEAYRADMVAALAEIENLQRQGRLALDLTQQSRSRHPFLLPSARRTYDLSERLWKLCLEEAAADRRQANLGLRQCSDGTPLQLLAYRMLICRSDVTAIQNRIDALAREMEAS